MRNLTLMIIIVALLFTSCEKDLLQQNEAEEIVVVEAYLYAGEPVDDIYLTEMLTYAGEDTVYNCISDASIKIFHNDIEYTLISSDSAGWYHYPAEGLEVILGDSYSLEFDYFDKTITSSTFVPEPPVGVTISDTAIYIDESAIQTDPREFIQSIPQIELNWDESEGDYFYVLVENIEENPEDIDLGMVGDRFGNFRFISRPVPLNSFILMPMMVIQQYGTHLVRIFKVNQEYADLYESMEQDSRNLNEPLTNIENGLGIFTAFSCDSIYFEVIKN